jgi:beta-lactamase regulating signal transducer with metallopeptidase domain
MIPYIIHVALILTGCLLFYKLLLQKETFYRVNRYLLLLCMLISFGLPLLSIPEQWSFRKTGEQATEYNPGLIITESYQPETIQSKTVNKNSNVTINTNQIKRKSDLPSQVGKWIIYLYWFGVIVFALNFLLQLVILLYRAYNTPVIVDGQYRIAEVSGDKAPCSFGNTIFINPEKYDWDTYQQILQHEKIHIAERHTLDIVLTELVLIFQWFNPFAWMYRKEIESNLEYLTDNQLVEVQQVEKTGYQMSLLKVSSPHFPLSLTTNYNQSLLKKRIVMMNAKKSSVHTAWKYFFLLPVLVLFAALMNEPVSYAQNKPDSKIKEKAAKKEKMNNQMDTEGYWFATIKGDKISFQFKRDEDENSSMNNSSFPLSEFPNLPKGTAGTFTVKREAGTMEFNGKFDGNQGMGKYKFVADKQYGTYMTNETGDQLDDKDLMVFFFLDIKKSYVQMLKSQGYPKVKKDDLIPLVALNINKEFISSIKSNGYSNIGLDDLIPLKSLGIDGNYIKEIKSAGYPNITVEQLITFKAQGIDQAYIKKMEQMPGKENKSNERNTKNTNKSVEKDADDIVTFKALGIDAEFINSFKSVGFESMSKDELVPMKALGITPEYVKSFQDMGYSDIEPHDLPGLKSQNVTPDFIKGFHALGFKNIPLNQVISLKAMNVDSAYITKMKDKGFDFKNLEKYIQLKAID